MGMTGPAGFEPATSGSGGRRSIHSELRALKCEIRLAQYRGVEGLEILTDEGLVEGPNEAGLLYRTASPFVEARGEMLFLGIDLAASDERPSGYCLLSSRDMSCTTGVVKRDEELLGLALSARPRVVAIDAPLSFAANGGPFRRCDLEARRRGFMVLPLNLPSMAKLTARGVRLKTALKERGLEVIEVFPTGGFRALGIEPPKRGVDEALEGLRRIGLRLEGVKSVHELDAAMAAYTAYKYFMREVEVLGDPVEGVIVIPRP